MTGAERAGPPGPARVLLLFVDGVGLGPAEPDTNPLAAAELPTFTRLIGGPPTLERAGSGTDRATLFAIDATMDVPGLPQSGTGHAALFTGINAAREFGRHFGPWVPTTLRPLVMERSILRRAVDAGKRVAFANAYPEELSRGGVLRGPVARTGPPLAAYGAGVLVRHADALRAGDAVASEITNGGWRDRLGIRDLPDPTPAEAGRTLARIAGEHDLTLFAHYSTDYIGHRGSFADCVAAIEKVDGFLGGVVDGLAEGGTVVVVSDHGNLEVLGKGHTRNPALGMVVGREVGRGMRIEEVAGFVG